MQKTRESAPQPEAKETAPPPKEHPLKQFLATRLQAKMAEKLAYFGVATGPELGALVANSNIPPEQFADVSAFLNAKEALDRLEETGELAGESEKILREEMIFLIDSAKKTITSYSDWPEWAEAKAYHHIATAQAQAGDFDSATQTANVIKDPSDKSRTLAAIATTEAKAGWFDEAKKTALIISEDNQKSVALAEIATAEVEAGLDSSISIKIAKETAAAFTNDYWKRDAYLAITIAEAKAGLIDDALETVKLIPSGHNASEAYLAIANAEAEAGRNPSDSINKAKNDFFNIYLGGTKHWIGEFYLNIIKAEIKAGGDAFEAFRNVKRIFAIKVHNVTKPRAFCNIAVAEAQAGLDPTSTFEKAKEIADMITDDAKRSQAFVDIAVAEAEAGFDPYRSMNIAKGIALTLEDININKFRILLDIASIAAREGIDVMSYFHSAKQTAGKLTNSSWKATAYRDIATTQAQVGLITDALETIKLIRYSIDQIDAKMEIVKVLAGFLKGKSK